MRFACLLFLTLTPVAQAGAAEHFVPEHRVSGIGVARDDISERTARCPFRPLEVTSLVEPEDYARQLGKPEALAHCSGQVFDIDYAGLPPGELECLRFVLDDLGWDGYLGFVEDGMDSLHIGCSPASRDFFTSVFQEAARE